MKDQAWESVMEVLVFGALIGFGIVAISSWVPRRVWLRLLGQRWAVLVLDVSVFAWLVAIHGGSAEGAMAASIAAACVHFSLRWQRWWHGHIRGHRYYPGFAHRNGWRRMTADELR